MSMKRILDADKLIGPVDMSYDRELAEYETSVRHSEAWIYFPQPMQTPLEMEREADKFLEETLAKIK